MALTKARNRMIDEAFVNIKDFGATGDGVTDDAVAIQAAFSEANGTVSKTVYFPAGTYIVNSTIITNPNTTNGDMPNITGDGPQGTIIKAGATLSTNPILKHQGASPSVNTKWTGFRLQGTGAADGQWGVSHINTCFVNYDNITFYDLAEGIRFENLAAGFTEQNVLTNCRAVLVKYFLGFHRLTGSTASSFRGTGFASECHMDLTSVADSRMIQVHLNAALHPNLYDTPLNISVWANASSVVTNNDGTTPIRATGTVRYESSAAGWTLGTGSATDTFTGVLDGISYNPTSGTYQVRGFVNGNLWQNDSPGYLMLQDEDPELLLKGSLTSGAHNNKITFQSAAGSETFSIEGSYYGGASETTVAATLGQSLVFDANATETIRLDSSTGYVGITEATPSKLLDLNNGAAGGDILCYDIYTHDGGVETSDQRLKRDISISSLGLEFVNLLNPVSYKWKDVDEVIETETVEIQKTEVITKDITYTEIIENGGKYIQQQVTKTQEVEEPVFEKVDLYNQNGDVIGEHKIPVMETIERVVNQYDAESYTRTHYGLISQEVESVLSGLNLNSDDFAGFVYDKDRDRYGLRYIEFISPLIKAIQELTTRIEQLENN